MFRWSGRAVAAAATTAALCAIAAPRAHAQEPALVWDNYEKVTLSTTLGEPIDLAVLPDRRVLTTARDGAVRLVDPATGTTKVVNQLSVYTSGEMGLQTVTLDPDFATNKWVYLYYAPVAMDAPFPPSTPSGNAPGTLPAGETEAYWDRWKGYNQLSRFKWNDSASALDGFGAPLMADKQTGLSVASEKAYYKKASQGLPDVIGMLGIVETLIFSIGAVLGATITMHASVSQRSREIGVLRALGFGRLQILFSFVVESAALGLGGALIGAAVSLLTPLLDFRCINFATGQEVAFRFVPSFTNLGLAIIAGTAVGAFGGLLPAIRAARVTPVQAMRA